ncbi:sensor histidine kinase [Agromyces sp. NPDC056523]|uniref:sensor histidine kinase n=1 Tax=Agromyces sp. NPDC056523 TaxID=3345850 RepID=UPI00366EFD53
MLRPAPASPPVIDGVEWVRPGPTSEQVRNDAVLAAVLTAATAASVVLYRSTGYGSGVDWWWAALWVAGIALPLAARRMVPELVALVVAAVFMAGGIAGVGELLFCNITLFIAMYSVGAWSRSRVRSLIVRAVIVLAMFTWLIWSLLYSSAVQDYLPELGRDADGPLSPYVAYGLINVVTNLLYFGGAWYFGDSAYRSARARAELEQRTAELAAERERLRAQAVALERMRIARELHDSVAHHVSVMGVQAGAARRVLERDPQAAASALSSIEQSARDAVDELRRTVVALRTPGADTGPIDVGSDGGADAAASTLRIAQVSELVDEARAAELPIDFTVVGEPREVTPLVDLAVYRIAQEALTNVRKHAGRGARADVRLRWLDDAIELEVADTGLGERATTGSAPGGLGQVGMRERVAAAGGTLELGPRTRGGYLVRARIPYRSGRR